MEPVDQVLRLGIQVEGKLAYVLTAVGQEGDLLIRLHPLRLYACDQSVFPTVGSVNPSLTGLTLAKRLAEQL